MTSFLLEFMTPVLPPSFILFSIELYQTSKKNKRISLLTNVEWIEMRTGTRASILAEVERYKTSGVAGKYILSPVLKSSQSVSSVLSHKTSQNYEFIATKV
jgi:hypothetical protein